MPTDKNFIPSAGNIPFDTQPGIVAGTSNLNDAPPKDGGFLGDSALKVLTDASDATGGVIGIGSGNGNDGTSPVTTEPYNFNKGDNPDADFSAATWLLQYLKQGGLTINPFIPDPNASPSDNLSALSNWINSIFNLYDFSANPTDLRNYGALLQYVYTTLSNSANGNIRDLSDAASLELAEKIADQCYSFINAQFETALSYQSWYLQQEYNSPLNQVNRLAAAGLHSSFALGNLNSGNAQQMAGVPSVQQPSMSNAGQAEAQSGGNVFGLIGSIASSVLSFIPAIATASGSLIKNVTDADVAKKLLPLQAAKMGAEIATNTQQVYNMRNDIAMARSNQALRTMDTLFNESKDILSSAENEVQVADNAYKTMMIQGTSKLKELTWETRVRDKNGHERSYTMDNEEMRDCFRNGGRTRSGDVVVGSENWSNELEASIKAGAKKGNSSSTSSNTGSSTTDSMSKMEGDHFGGKDFGNTSSSTTFNSNTNSLTNSILNAFNVQLDIEGSASNKYIKGGAKSDSHEESFETNYDTSTGKSKSNIGYNEDGTEFHVGKSVFKSTSRERIVTLKEHFDKIQQARKYFEDSVNRYNALTKEQQTRLLYWQDMLRDNIGNFTGAFCGHDYANRIKLMFQPRELVGD